MSGDLTRLLDATWPAAECFDVGPFTLRRSDGGGKRVLAATARGEVTDADIVAAEHAMDECGQQAIFSVRADQADLERLLVDRTYLALDPTRLFRIGTADLAGKGSRGCAAIWPPCDDQIAIWESGHVGEARRAVMQRAAAPKTALLVRAERRPAGTCFVAVHDGIAIVHAMEVLPEYRRRGLAREMLVGAAEWAQEKGADRLIALVTEADTGSARLFEALGFAGAHAYHYRIRP